MVRFLLMIGLMVTPILGLDAMASILKISFSPGQEDWIRVSKTTPGKYKTLADKELGSISLELDEDLPLKQAFTNALKKESVSLLRGISYTILDTTSLTLLPYHFEIQGQFLGQRLISTRDDASVWDKTLKTLGITEETLKTSYKKQLSITLN